MAAPGQTQRSASKFIVFENFEKMNTQSVRQALSEKELAWLENLQPIAGNNLTTVPAPLPALTTISETITSQYYANLGTVDYIVSFTSVGSGWATNIATAVSTRFASPGTFSNPDMTVWQSQYILFNDPTVGYSAWNGSIFSHSGGVSPILIITNGGTGYTSVPTVTISGGSGSGATAVATIATPAVTAVNVITAGSAYTSAPAVVFAGGGGTGAAATAIIDPRGLTSFTITNPGNYTPLPGVPTISFTGGGGTGAAAVVSNFALSGGQYRVLGVTITNPGTGYTSAPTVVFSGGGVIPPGGAAGTVTVGNGRVLSINVTSGGGGYTSAPTVSLTGGGGSGATAAAVVGGSFVSTLTLTNPGAGYLASDVLTVAFSGGGGSGAAATAHVWPFVTPGTTLAVFQGRVWLGGGRLIQYTGTQGFDDFDVANASASFTISDADLVHAVTALRNYNNYLFIMGDQSVKQIGNISLNAAGNVTLFTILTLSSDQGTIYPRSCGSFNRVFMFANSNGIYAVFGSSVQKISDDMDGIFKLIDFSQQPQAALADINAIHNIMFLVRYKDPLLPATRSIMLTFTGKKWFVVSQGDSLNTITTASTLASGKTMTFGSSGGDITQILGSATTPVAFKAQSSLTHHGNAVQRKKIIRGGFAATTALPPWNVATVYGIGDYVTWLTVSYISQITPNTGNDPTNTTTSPPVWVSTTSYNLGAVVTGSNGETYSSLGGGNTGHDPVTDAGAHWLDLGVKAAWLPVTSAAETLVMTVDTENGSLNYTKALSVGFQAGGWSVDGAGKYLGMTITGTLAGFTLTDMAIEFQETSLWT